MMETRISLSEREALLIVTALGTLQNRVGQRVGWDQRKRLRTLRSRLTDAVIISDEQEQKELRRALANANRRIERGINLGREVSALRERVKQTAGITDEKVNEPETEEEAPAAKPLVDEGFCYVITENKGGFCKGDFFEGKARNVLHHARTAFEFEANEEIMKDFVKLGLWAPTMVFQLNDVTMQEVNGAVQPVTYNFRGEIDSLDNAEAIEGYVYRVHGVFYAYLKGKWRRKKNDECWNPITGEQKIIASWDMSEED